MHIKSIEIKDLYGTFNYYIEMKRESNLCVLTGLNGYGKTTILNMIHSLCNKEEIYYFHKIPFRNINVVFDNSAQLEIRKVELSHPVEDDRQIFSEETTDFSLIQNDRKIAFFRITEEDYENSSYFKKLQRKKDKVNHLLFMWEQKHEGEVVQVVDQNLDRLYMMLSSLHDTFISSQRLFSENYERNDEDDRKPMLDKVLDTLQDILKNNYFSFLQYSQKRDSNFIDVLLSTSETLSEKDYNAKAATLYIQIEELINYGLLPKTRIRPYDDKHVRELTAYIKELELKLAQYNSLRKKLNLFTKLLAEKHFVNKEFKFTRKDGLRVWLPKSNMFLSDIYNLSSGEQNEIILLCKLIFEVPDGSILLIDEPELSLHVAWQLQFINDIKAISKNRDIQIIIATHSAAIVSESLEDCYDLTDQNSKVNG